MLSLLLHSWFLLPAGLAFTPEIDFETLPRYSPSREFVEQLVHAINRGPTIADEVEILTDYLRQGADFRRTAICATLPEWKEECDQIANTLFQRKATAVEIVVWQGVCFPGNDIAARTLVIRRQERKKPFLTHGRVWDAATGQPIENAVVRGPWPHRTTTNVEGKFSFETRTDQFDRFLLAIEAEGKGRYQLERPKDDPTAEEEVAAPLEAEAPFHGLVEEAGKGIENVGVVVTASPRGRAKVRGRPFAPAADQRFAATTDVNGRFRIRGVAAASAYMRIDVASPGYYRENGENSVPFRAGTEDDPIRLEVKPCTVVQGVVVDEAGKPLPIAEVEIREPGTFGHQVSTTADHNGRFSFNWRRAGKWRLVAERTGRTLGSADVEFNKDSIQDVRIVMPREGGYIEGTVLLPDGKPANECYVGCSCRSSAPPARGFINARADDLASNHLTVTDALGRFKLGPLPSDELYQFTAALDAPNQSALAKAKPGDPDVVVQLVHGKQ